MLQPTIRATAGCLVRRDSKMGQAEFDPHLLRQSAMEELRSIVDGECFNYTVRDIGGVHHYSSGQGTSHLCEIIEPVRGRPVLGGTRAERLKAGWSLESPLPIHTNRFARLVDDFERGDLRNTATWSNFYGPAGIEDQLRALFYANGEFIGFLAISRGEAGSFDLATRERVNRIRGRFFDAFRMAWSLEQEALGLGELHLILDERGEVLHAGEVAATWLTPRRSEAIAASVASGRRLVDGMLLSLRQLDHHGWFYGSLTAAPTLRVDRRRGLSEMQRAIVAMTERGLTNSEIADALGLAVSTVKYHLRFVFDAMGVDSRSALIAAG